MYEVQTQNYPEVTREQEGRDRVGDRVRYVGNLWFIFTPPQTLKRLIDLLRILTLFLIPDRPKTLYSKFESLPLFWF